MRSNVLRDRSVTLRAERIIARAKLWVARGIHMRMGVARHARRVPLEEALALPECKRLVCEPARAAIGPECSIFRCRQPILHYRQEVVVVIPARLEAVRVNIP